MNEFGAKYEGLPMHDVIFGKAALALGLPSKDSFQRFETDLSEISRKVGGSDPKGCKTAAWQPYSSSAEALQ